MTMGQQALQWINEQIATGHTVYLSNYLKAWEISPATVKKWKKSENDLFRVDSKGDLFIARGKNFDCIISGSILHVKISAQ